MFSVWIFDSCLLVKDRDLTTISHRQQWKRMAGTLAGRCLVRLISWTSKGDYIRSTEKRNTCYVLYEERFQRAGLEKAPDWEDLAFLELSRKLDWMYYSTVPVVNRFAGPINTKCWPSFKQSRLKTVSLPTLFTLYTWPWGQKNSRFDCMIATSARGSASSFQSLLFFLFVTVITALLNSKQQKKEWEI